MDKTRMIGFGVDYITLEPIIQHIEKVLINFNVPYELVDNPHISIAVIKEKIKKDELVRLVHNIHSDFKFNIKGFAILKGYDNDFITIELKANDMFVEILNSIKENYKIIQHTDIKPHISLVKISSGIAGENFLIDVFENIKMINNIKTNKVELWNSDFQVDYTKK